MLHENRFVKLLFYGNYFYGFCTAALVAETVALFNLKTNWLLFGLTFLSTVLFYNYPYARKNTNPNENPRITWILANKKLLITNQIVCTVLLIIGLLWLAANFGSKIEQINVTEWFFVLIFPVVGGLYYGINFLSNNFNLRQIGWVKPFLIGFVWAGVANVFPILYAKIIGQQSFELNGLVGLQFLKNMMFTAMLAIMFDIKDYADDSRNDLKTLVVRLGLRKTLFYVVIPFTILGIITFLSYAITHNYHLTKIVLTSIPFVSLLLTTHTFHKQRNLLFYLVMIDGLFLVKAVFGIAAIYI